MTRAVVPAAGTVAGAGSRRPTSYGDLFDTRRRDLTLAAVAIWGESGYAQVSVRNVARRTQIGHGLVHYYFKNKDALVAACMAVIEDAHLFECDLGQPHDVDGLSHVLAGGIVTSFVRHERLHRIRYDLRYQALFDPTLRRYLAASENEAASLARQVGARYERLGHQFDMPFELVAAHMDALFQRAVHDSMLGRDSMDSAVSLRRDLSLILPSSRR